MKTFGTLLGLLPDTLQYNVIFVFLEKPMTVFNGKNPLFSKLFGVDVRVVPPVKGCYNLVRVVFSSESGLDYNYFERNGKVWIIGTPVQTINEELKQEFIEFCTK